MRVMVDTNVLISAVLFRSSRVTAVLSDIATRHTLVLSSFVVEELRAVVERKFPSKIEAIDAFLHQMAFELVYTPQNIEEDLFDIRDPKDYPVLYTAMTNGIDLLITGDKDFADVKVDFPEIITPTAYMEKYM